ncbi:uncharacterized protein EDB91DRAFT_1018458, partial [Suillus paluster]|uniref:uncharacterized protein n=1 Tax=Suillus paluster TaxID=48578 RepID=UPI001B85DD7F
SWATDDNQDNRYLKCPLSRIEYYKCADDVEHEFLVFYFKHWTHPNSEAVVSVDRTVHQRDGCSKQSSEIISPSSSENNAAFDSVSLLGSPHDAASPLLTRYGQYKKLCTLLFSSPSAPSALEVSIVLSLVNQQAPAYHLYEKQCYWFSDTVWRSLKKLFPTNQESCRDHNARCRYRGI